MFGLTGAGISAAALLVALRPSRPEVLYKVTFLPTLGGIPVVPHAIKDRGQVVGAAEVTLGQWHMVLWDKDKGLQAACKMQNASGIRMVCQPMQDLLSRTYFSPREFLRYVTPP